MVVESMNTEPKSGGGTRKALLLPPWGWGEALVASGCVLCVVAAAALPWARVDVIWKSILFAEDIDLGTYSFRLTDNPWLAGALICVAALCLAGLFWRRHAGHIAVSASLLLIAGSIAYVISLVEDAYDFLGFYERLLELVRSLPMVGPVVEAVVRERLAVSAFPHVGMFVFLVSSLLIVCGGLIIGRRRRADV